MSEIIEGLLRILGFKIAKRKKEPTKPWLVDRDGRVIVPTRRVVLKARPRP